MLLIDWLTTGEEEENSSDSIAACQDWLNRLVSTIALVQMLLLEGKMVYRIQYDGLNLLLG